MLLQKNGEYSKSEISSQTTAKTRFMVSDSKPSSRCKSNQEKKNSFYLHLMRIQMFPKMYLNSLVICEPCKEIKHN